jgi:hypothetical protein
VRPAPAPRACRAPQPNRIGTADFPIATDARSPTAGFVQATLG